MPFDLIILDGQIITDRKTGQPRIKLFEAGLVANSEIEYADRRTEKYGMHHDLNFLGFIAETLQAAFPGRDIYHNKQHFDGLNYRKKHEFFEQFQKQSYNSKGVIWHTDPLLLSQILSMHQAPKPVTLLSSEGTVAASTMSKALFCYHLKNSRPDVMPETLFIHPDELENSKACIQKICDHFNENLVILKPSISSNSENILVVNVHPQELEIALDFYKQRALKTDKNGLVVQSYVNCFTVRDAHIFRGKIRWILAVDGDRARLLGAYRNEVKSPCSTVWTYNGYLKNIEAIKARTEAMVSSPFSENITAFESQALESMAPMIEPIAFEVIHACRSVSLEQLLKHAYDEKQTLVVSDICRHLLSFVYPPALENTLLALASNERTRMDVFGYLKGNIFNKAFFLSDDFPRGGLLNLVEKLAAESDTWKDLLQEPLKGLLNEVLQECMNNADFDATPHRLHINKLRELIRQCKMSDRPRQSATL